MKPRWRRGKLRLGKLGTLWVTTFYDKPAWALDVGSGGYWHHGYKSVEAAQRAAVRWLRAALKQAARRIGT